jgi:hypothetical protein
MLCRGMSLWDEVESSMTITVNGGDGRVTGSLAHATRRDMRPWDAPPARSHDTFFDMARNPSFISAMKSAT